MAINKSGKVLPKGIIWIEKKQLYMGRFQYQNATYTKYGKNWRKLEKELQDLRYEVEHGLRGKGDSTSLNEWFDVWLNAYKRRVIKDSTYVRYKYLYEHYIQGKLGRRRISNIKQIIIQKLINELAENNYSTSTIRDIYDVLHSIFNLAIQNESLVRNPCNGIVLPKTKEKERRVLTIEEERILLEYAENRLCESLIKVALGTGMRAGELLGLTWQDINFETNEINVDKTLVYIRDIKNGKYGFKFQTPKTKAGIRVIPMQRNVKEALKKQKEQLDLLKNSTRNWEYAEGFEGLVFLNRTGKPRQGIDFRNDLKRIEQAINKDRKKESVETREAYTPIEHFHPHSLRHTFATRCFEAGIEAKVVQNYLGHASISMTLDLYTHVSQKKAKMEMDKLQKLYGEDNIRNNVELRKLNL